MQELQKHYTGMIIVFVHGAFLEQLCQVMLGCVLGDA
jgi:hypothetical protein